MDGQNVNVNVGNNYAGKMDVLMTRALQEWWRGLTKEEILNYLAEQKCVTADDLRNMIGNNSAVLAFDVRFSSNNLEAVTDFHKNK